MNNKIKWQFVIFNNKFYKDGRFKFRELQITKSKVIRILKVY